MRITFVLFLCLIFSLSIFGQFDPQVKKQGKKVVEVNNLAGKPHMEVCKIPGVSTGTVIETRFRDEGTMESFVLRDLKGEQHSIYLNNDRVKLLGNQSLSIVSALLKQGNKINVKTLGCYREAGSFYYADKITLIR